MSLRDYVKEAARIISRDGIKPFLARTLGGDTNFKIGKFDQLTGKAKLASGETVDVDAVGSPNQYSAVQMTGSQGVVFAKPAIQTGTSGSSRSALVALLQSDNQVYLRYLGGSQLYSIPISIPTGAMDIQAKFSSNAKHFMVGLS